MEEKMKNKKVCVYTCITGNYDNLNEITPEVYEENIDYYCFTNNQNIKSDTWNVVYIKNNGLSNHLEFDLSSTDLYWNKTQCSSKHLSELFC